MPAMAVTDHGNMFAIKEYLNYLGKKKGKLEKKIKELEGSLAAAKEADDKTGIRQLEGKIEHENRILENLKAFKPIVGCEMYVAQKDMYKKIDKKDTGRHLVVLAKNLTGYKNLIKLVSKAFTDGFYSHPRTDKASLAAHREGLVICSACLGGEIPQLLMRGEFDEADRQVKWWKDTFGEDYYLELQRHKSVHENRAQDVYKYQKEIEPKLLELAKKYGIKVVATNDVHFVNEDDAEAHDRLICLSTNKLVSDTNRMVYTQQEWFKTSEEMSRLFSDIPEALETTLEIAGKVEKYSIDHAPIMPAFPIPESFGTEEEYRSRLTEQDLFDEFTRDENGNVVLSEADAKKKIEKLGGYEKLYRIKFEADYLKKIAYEGAIKRYGAPLSDEIEERLRFELHIMKTMGFPGYFLIVEDFIRVGREELGVSIGPGRGSAAGSVVAYCLGITQIDPLKYDLLFERFLNPDRISLPDIDIDLDDEGRADVLRYVTEKYGEEKVAHIITYGTMATKSAIKDVARVNNLPLPESNRLAKLVPDRMPEVKGKSVDCTLENCCKYLDSFKKELSQGTELVKETLQYATKLEGTVRNIGVHACGVIICRDDITDWVPISVTTDKNEGKLLVTQYEGSVIEETGLIKMDFLGLKTLSIIKEAVANVKQARGIDINIDEAPLDDVKTYQLYSAGRTTGTFQFESMGMQKHLRELKPTTFEDLIAMNALYRPGPMEYIPDFIARKHGRKPIVYDIPEMEKYLKDTYGITVYQEQVMLLSRLLAGFTRGESDTLRKAMGKKLKEKMAELKGKFLSGGQERGHKEEVLQKIWADWEKFASYAFNKSHATCYSWVAFQTAYLKANYPAEYMAAVLSRNLADIKKLTQYMDECRVMGITVLGPDINESYHNFGVNKEGNIRFGLTAIKGVGQNVVNFIVEAREKGGPFKDIYDFVERVPVGAVNRRTLENLAVSGALDCFPELAREDYFAENSKNEPQSETLLRYGAQVQADKLSQEVSLFGDDLDIISASRPELRKGEPWAPVIRLDKERELVGMYLSAHPLDPYFLEVSYGMSHTLKELEEIEPVENREISFAGIVMGFETKVLKSGMQMGIFKLEDYSGSGEFVVFGKQLLEYEKYGKPGIPLMVRASYRRNKNGDLRMNIGSVELLDDVKGKLIKGITLRLQRDQLNGELRDVLDELIHGNERKNSPRHNNPITVKEAAAVQGLLNVNVYDPTSNRIIRLTSRHSIPLSRKMMETLEDLEIEKEIIPTR